MSSIPQGIHLLSIDIIDSIISYLPTTPAIYLSLASRNFRYPVQCRLFRTLIITERYHIPEFIALAKVNPVLPTLVKRLKLIARMIPPPLSPEESKFERFVKTMQCEKENLVRFLGLFAHLRELSLDLDEGTQKTGWNWLLPEECREAMVEMCTKRCELLEKIDARGTGDLPWERLLVGSAFGVGRPTILAVQIQLRRPRQLKHHPESAQSQSDSCGSATTSSGDNNGDKSLRKHRLHRLKIQCMGTFSDLFNDFDPNDISVPDVANLKKYIDFANLDSMELSVCALALDARELFVMCADSLVRLKLIMQAFGRLDDVPPIDLSSLKSLQEITISGMRTGHFPGYIASLISTIHAPFLRKVLVPVGPFKPSMRTQSREDEKLISDLGFLSNAIVGLCGRLKNANRLEVRLDVELAVGSGTSLQVDVGDLEDEIDEIDDIIGGDEEEDSDRVIEGDLEEEGGIKGTLERALKLPTRADGKYDGVLRIEYRKNERLTSRARRIMGPPTVYY